MTCLPACAPLLESVERTFDDIAALVSLVRLGFQGGRMRMGRQRDDIDLARTKSRLAPFPSTSTPLTPPGPDGDTRKPYGIPAARGDSQHAASTS